MGTYSTTLLKGCLILESLEKCYGEFCSPLLPLPPSGTSTLSGVLGGEHASKPVRAVNKALTGRQEAVRPVQQTCDHVFLCFTYGFVCYNIA